LVSHCSTSCRFRCFHRMHLAWAAGRWSAPQCLNQAVTYHVALVNEPRRKKVIQADFRLNF
jgi:hypothetical protein